MTRYSFQKNIENSKIFRDGSNGLFFTVGIEYA